MFLIGVQDAFGLVYTLTSQSVNGDVDLLEVPRGLMETYLALRVVHGMGKIFSDFPQYL